MWCLRHAAALAWCVVPQACVRVYARVLVPPNLYIHNTYIISTLRRSYTYTHGGIHRDMTTGYREIRQPRDNLPQNHGRTGLLNTHALALSLPLLTLSATSFSLYTKPALNQQARHRRKHESSYIQGRPLDVPARQCACEARAHS